ncbi:unnamed protein product [Rotaria socialis]|uniref:Uncharacterized protein n=1 Tax=Rotaria socialis TaxID=392032 RepID=A0A819V551_9BILA|nr:unnamed protein product [Rotaria socialis]CAF3241997.1 unnamed protein product [Rotaria socialis]CAF4099450.1 unnamed protein product [Rotaria socialis]CAF4210975.1 unnamed protein product [Rotaria socialis]
MSTIRTSPLLSNRLNPFLSEANFKKSCEIVHTKSKRYDKNMVDNILVHDDPDKAFIEINKRTFIWYLAIGSMTNPISLYLRDLTPLVSYPVKCPDYRLAFRDCCGMADIEYCPGKEFHGVVHLLPMKQMLYLDQIEHIYKRIIVNAIDYQQCSHLVYVYKMNLVEQQERLMNLPSERYVDLIVKGCEYFGVHTSYINRLKHEQPVIARKLPTTYEKITNVPDNVFFTNEDLLKHNGKDPNFSLWISVNGKILEYKGLPSDDHPDYANKKQFYEFVLSCLGGREVTHAIARSWYEPMYKLPLNDDDLTDEHRAFAEDMCVSCCLKSSGNSHESCWRPIGRLRKTSKKSQS